MEEDSGILAYNYYYIYFVIKYYDIINIIGIYKKKDVCLLVDIKNKYLTEEIYNSLPDIIIEKYSKCFDNKDETVKEIIDTIIVQVDNTLTEESLSTINYSNNDSDRVIRDLLTYNNKMMQRQKKRWYKCVKDELKEKKNKNYKYIMKEIEVMELLIQEMGTDNLKIKDTNELIKKRLKQVEEWSLDKNSLVIDFPYLKSLTKNQIMNAFAFDLKNIIYNKLLNNYAGNTNSYIVSHPNILFQMGALFGVSNKMPINLNQRVNSSTKKNEFYYKYNSGDKTVVSIVAKNKNIKAVNPVLMHNLDQDDMILFLSTLSFRKADFIRTKMIRVYFRDIIKYLNKPISRNTYNFIKERYDKLFNRQFEISYTEGDRHIVHKISFFQYLKYDVNNKYNDRSYVDVQVSDFIAQQIIDMQTTNMYKNQIMSFTNAVSKLIMFPLQRDRIDCYIYNSDYKKSYFYDYFTSTVIFPQNNNKKENISLLIESFKEFKKQNIIIDAAEYNSEKEVFNIKFIPLNEIEIEDFVNNNGEKLKRID